MPTTVSAWICTVGSRSWATATLTEAEAWSPSASVTVQIAR